MKLRLATRGSKLAMIQAQLAAAALSQRYPEHEFVLEPLATHGDRNPSMPLTDSPREGVFVKELEQALLDGRAELAVHSAKDLPTLATPGLVLAAFLPRADARDAVISRQPSTLQELPSGASVGTGSPRRVAQLAAIRPDFKFVAIRGNVDTRLRKLGEGVVDALVVAAAGLERLERLDEAHELLPFDVMLPAPGQGAIAVQAVEGSVAAGLAAAVDDPSTSRAVHAERELLRRLGGGCLSAIGAYAMVAGAELLLKAVVLDERGDRVVRAEARGLRDDAVVDKVANDLESQGAPAMLRASQGPLSGLSVMVTRADRQSAGLSEALRKLGATVVICPVIAIEPIAVDPAVVTGLDRYDWLVLTSANGVDRLFELLAESNSAVPTHIEVAAIGPETAARLKSYGIEAALVPERFIAEDLAEALIRRIQPGSRVLLARAAGSRDVLPDRLRTHGALVDIVETYRTVAPPGLSGRLVQCLPGVDIITFTSSSTVRHFVEAAATPLPAGIRVAAIGPITAETARAAGLPVAIIAQEYTTRGLVEAIVRSRAPISA